MQLKSYKYLPIGLGMQKRCDRKPIALLETVFQEYFALASDALLTSHSRQWLMFLGKELRMSPLRYPCWIQWRIVEDSDRKAIPQIFVLNAKDQWVCKGEPIHFDTPSAGTGLGFAFAKLVAQNEPCKTIGLIPCAVGGTSIEKWQPGEMLFERAVRRTRVAMKAGTLKGILWHQGESNSTKAESAAGYGPALQRVLEGFRESLPDVPILVGQLGDFTLKNKNGSETFARSINEQIKTTAETLPGVFVVSAEGLVDKGDRIHFDSASLKEFGRRYYEVWKASADASASGSGGSKAEGRRTGYSQMDSTGLTVSVLPKLFEPTLAGNRSIRDSDAHYLCVLPADHP